MKAPLDPRAIPTIIVTGPDRAITSAWIDGEINRLRAGQPGWQGAWLRAENTAPRRGTATRFPDVRFDTMFLPCLCCPANARLPARVEELVATGRADTLFIELPALAAAGLIVDFDTVLGWPRQVVVCLNPSWEAARHSDLPSPFMAALLDRADTIVPPRPRPTPPPSSSCPAP